MRRCMHRVLGFMKPALESVYLPLFTDLELHIYVRRNMHHETQKSMHASLRVSTCVGHLTDIYYYERIIIGKIHCSNIDSFF